MGKEVLIGRLNGKRVFKSVCFLDILTPNREITQAVVEDIVLVENLRNISKGSILKVEGELRNTSLSRKYEREFYVSHINVLANNYQINVKQELSERKDFRRQIDAFLSDKVKMLLEFRSEISQCIRNYFNKGDFIEVQSPKIVDSLVEGPTNAFEVGFYGRKSYLSISNVLYHHMLLTLGYDKIYEISPNFRQQPYKSKYQLSEFWALDFSEAWRGRENMIRNLEDLLNFTVDISHRRFDRDLIKFGITLPKLPKHIEIVEYQEVLKWLNLKEKDYGTHVPRRLTDELKSRNLNALWVVDAPIDKKPFFIKRKDNVSLTAELWTDRVPILASGGERINDYKEALDNMLCLGIKTENFENYLYALKFGAPPSYTIGMGIERLLQYLTLQPLNHLAIFPRFPEASKKFKRHQINNLL